jgi:hypothetical protein
LDPGLRRDDSSDEQRLLAQQVQRLAALVVPIEGSAQPTQIFVKVSEAEKVQ